MPEPFQRAVLDHSVLQKYRTGAWIYRRGDPSGGMYGLVRGSLAADIAPDGRGPCLGYVLRPGTWLGDASFVTGLPRQVSVQAKRTTEILYLPAHAMNAIAHQDPAAWRYFALNGYEYQGRLASAVADLVRRDHTKRFIAMLLHMGDCRLASPASPDPIEIDVGQSELAALANVARTTAGSMLRELAQAGYIGISYRRISIVSPDALRAILVRRGPGIGRRRPAKPDSNIAVFGAKTKRASLDNETRRRQA
jgi:CRP/FNR family cyclic AMP-dependent transcriptional regulator